MPKTTKKTTKKHKYIMTFDVEDCGDPAIRFYTLNDVKKFIQALNENNEDAADKICPDYKKTSSDMWGGGLSSIIRDSIKLYEIKKELSFSVDINIKEV